MAFSYFLDPLVQVELDPAEVSVCRDIAEKWTSCQKTEKFNPLGHRTQFENNFIGVLGEAAAHAWYYGDEDYQELFFESKLIQCEQPKPDVGWDLRLGQWTCDVKTTAMAGENPPLIVSPLHVRKKPDYFLHARIDFDALGKQGDVTLIGTCSREEAAAFPPRCFTKDSQKPVHVVPRAKLKPINPDPPREAFWAYLELHYGVKRRSSA